MPELPDDDKTASDPPGPGNDEQLPQVLELLDAASGTWTVPVLRHLGMGVSRPADLVTSINAEGPASLSRKVLVETLQRLRASRLVSRQEVAAWPREVHYWLTPRGHEVLSQLSRLGPSGERGKDPESPPPAVDASRPSPARVWNYTIGGKDNFSVDREAATAVHAAMPSLPVTARLARRYQADAVRRLSKMGVRQYLDIGTGLPVAGAVHEIAQRAAPEARVLYVDNDPLVLAHARALLSSSREGSCDYLQADIRETGRIIARAAETLDLGQPVAIILMMVLHFVPDEDDPGAIVRHLVEGIRGPRYLVIGHAARDTDDTAAQAASDEYNRRSPVAVRLRSGKEVTALFEAAGTTLTDPVASLGEWWSRSSGEALPYQVNGHIGLGWRPGG
ncbi:MAG TPA: SAM-dependent methyltransferase [Trebonia sp.]|nr:SAM-dependent methyltransferase [Trebonia sp.]